MSNSLHPLRGSAAACLATLCFQATIALAAGVDDDLRQAAKLQKNGETPAAMVIWQRWAERGDADSAYNLAVIHQYGDGVPQSDTEAMKWYRRAAARGDRISEYQIGLMYQNGQGVPADQAEAHRWFTGHRAHHAHHDQSEEMQAWRKQASVLLEERDRREMLARSRADGDLILAELKRRAAGNAPAERVAGAGERKHWN